MRNQVYISNNSANSKSIDKIVLSKEKGIEQLHENPIDTSGNSIFIIDVHCTFKGIEKMQQQGGVIIYRHLLKIFEGKQDKLKVIFYSPLTQDQLVRLKPENYVLKLLPFIELFPETVQYGIKPEDWTFDKAIKEAEKENFPQFNNASENLLSGWALVNKEKIEKGQQPEKINTNGKKILFIDDQQSEWINTFLSIFKDKGKKILYIRKNENNELYLKEDFKTLLTNQASEFFNSVKAIINEEDVSMILSDFYLTENHEVEVFKESKEIELKSGSKVFSFLKDCFPQIPFVFHTSSNKANIYKYFDIRGVDDWIVKDVRVHAQSKKSHYDFFKRTILFYLQNETVEFLKNFWKSITEINNKYNNYWWYKQNLKKSDADADTIIEILKDAWWAMRHYLNKEDYFEYGKRKEWNNDSFTASAIISSLCQIRDFLGINDLDYHLGTLNHTIVKIRNLAAHSQNKDFYSFRFSDSIIFAKLILNLLENTKDEIKKNYPVLSSGKKNESYKLKISEKDFGNGTSTKSFKFGLFWVYIQMYNLTTTIPGYKCYKDYLERRIRELYDVVSNETDLILIREQYYKNDFCCENSGLLPGIHKTSSGQIKIIIS